MTYVPFDDLPTLELKHWTNCCQWSSIDKQIVRYKKGDRDFFCMSTGLEKSISTKECGKYFKIVDDLSWGSFKEYEEHIRTINYVQYDKKTWLLSRCSCVYWAKNYHCHHVVGLAVKNNKVAYLDVHKQIKIGQNRLRGQPKKTATALKRQQDYISSDSSEADSDSVDSDNSPVKKPVKKVLKKKEAITRQLKRSQ